MIKTDKKDPETNGFGVLLFVYRCSNVLFQPPGRGRAVVAPVFVNAADQVILNADEDLLRKVK